MPALAKILACHQNPCRVIVNFVLGKKFQYNHNQNNMTFIQWNVFEYAVCKKVSVLTNKTFMVRCMSASSISKWNIWNIGVLLHDHFPVVMFDHAHDCVPACATDCVSGSAPDCALAVLVTEPPTVYLTARMASVPQPAPRAALLRAPLFLLRLFPCLYAPFVRLYSIVDQTGVQCYCFTALMGLLPDT